MAPFQFIALRSLGRFTVRWTCIGVPCVTVTLPVVCWLNITSFETSTNRGLGCGALPTTRSCDCVVILGDSCHINTHHLLSESFSDCRFFHTECTTVVLSQISSFHIYLCKHSVLYDASWLVWHTKWKRNQSRFHFPFKNRCNFGF